MEPTLKSLTAEEIETYTFDKSDEERPVLQAVIGVRDFFVQGECRRWGLQKNTADGWIII
ncbi:hypothetical protein GCM10010912_47960 [Paenibacillus albidus]|uniref:Uncharacterized protein n=1 Tax=Paenibacillus albidus TaxID=2041023 RepID=A0A917CV14_9BACL|nr:hypothetical protein GCM10010912_47960 [Paenibacillus albidus]